MHRSLCIRPIAKRPYLHRAFVSNRRIIPCRASLSEVLITQSYLIGKGLTLFVLFTTTLNYLYYRSLRTRVEDTKKLNTKDRTEKKKDDGDL